MPSWTTPFTATTNAVISSSAHNSGVRDNLTHLHDILGTPSTSNQLLVSTGSGTAGWSTGPSGDTLLGNGTVTGNAGGSAIGVNKIHQNRIADPGTANIPVVSVGDSVSGCIFAALPAVGIASEAITEPKLDANNSPTNGYYLGYSSSDGRLTWIAPPAGVSGVPTGLHGFFTSDAALSAASGWSEQTAGAGRMIVSRGSVFSQTFNVGGTYGTDWFIHLHNVGGHAHSGSSVGASGASNAVTTNVNLAFGGSEEVNPGSHTHNGGSLSIAGDSTNTSPSAAYVPPIFGLILAYKT